jgi:hypothetical protein
VEPAAELLFALDHTLAPLTHSGDDRAGDGARALACNRYDLLGTKVLDGTAHPTLGPHSA